MIGLVYETLAYVGIGVGVLSCVIAAFMLARRDQ